MGWELLWGRTHEAPAGPGCTAARTACGWGFCPLGEEAPGLPVAGWGTAPSLGPAPVAKGSFPPEIPMARETPRRTSRTSSRQQARDRLWPRCRTLSPQCPLCCTRPCPPVFHWGAIPCPFPRRNSCSRCKMWCWSLLFQKVSPHCAHPPKLLPPLAGSGEGRSVSVSLCPSLLSLP